jgi:hypothetical protein
VKRKEILIKCFNCCWVSPGWSTLRKINYNFAWLAGPPVTSSSAIENEEKGQQPRLTSTVAVQNHLNFVFLGH